MPSHTYTTVGELKRILPKSMDADDTVYSNVIRAVTATIDEYCGREFDREGTGQRIFEADFQTLDNFPAMYIDDVPDIPGSTTTVELGDYPTGPWEAATDGDWWLSPVNPKRGWPYTQLAVKDTQGWRRRFIRINSAWGWAATPAPITRACLMWANRILSRETSPFGIIANAEYGSIYIGKVDSDIESLIRPYKRDFLLGK